MEAHAIQFSQGYKAKKGYTFWEKDFDGMAFKTMLRQLISKWGIMSIEMQDAYTKDMGVIQQDGAVEYVDNEPTEEIKQQPVIEERPEATKKASRRSAEVEPKEEAVDMVIEAEEADFEPSEDDFKKIFGED